MAAARVDLRQELVKQQHRPRGRFPKRGEAEVWSLGLFLSFGVEKRLRRGMVWYRVNVNLAGSVPRAPNALIPVFLKVIFGEMDKKGHGSPSRGLKIARKPTPEKAQLCDLRA